MNEHPWHSMKTHRDSSNVPCLRSLLQLVFQKSKWVPNLGPHQNSQGVSRVELAGVGLTSNCSSSAMRLASVLRPHQDPTQPKVPVYDAGWEGGFYGGTRCVQCAFIFSVQSITFCIGPKLFFGDRKCKLDSKCRVCHRQRHL